MANLNPTEQNQPFRLYAVVIFCLSLHFPPFALANGYSLKCENIFHSNSALLIAMNPAYRGEDKGRYIDPLSKTPWQVKYYTQREKNKFEAKIQKGLFLNPEGKKMTSEFDPESMSFETSLLVIDKNSKIYVLPFEARGKYHHSSLSSGDDIIFAGTVAFDNGVLKEITNSSGHYKPSTDHTIKTLRHLKKMGADLSRVSLTGEAARQLSTSFSIDATELQKILTPYK